MTDEAVRRMARQAIDGRRLPDRTPDRTWGGRGSGAPCSICGGVVKAEQAELELEFLRPDEPLPDTYNVHPRCFAAWEFERRSEMPLPPAGKPNGRAPAVVPAIGWDPRRKSVAGILPDEIDAITSVGREHGRPSGKGSA